MGSPAEAIRGDAGSPKLQPVVAPAPGISLPEPAHSLGEGARMGDDQPGHALGEKGRPIHRGRVARANQESACIGSKDIASA